MIWALDGLRNRFKWLRRGIFLLLVILYFGYTLLVYFFGTLPVTKGVLASRSEQRGKTVWQQQNCQACHQIYGLGGYLGPDLTDLMSVQGKGEPWVRAMLQSGPRTMPVFQIPEQDIVALADFLSAVDASGNFPEKDMHINWWGSFEF